MPTMSRLRLETLAPLPHPAQPAAALRPPDGAFLEWPESDGFGLLGLNPDTRTLLKCGQLVGGALLAIGALTWQGGMVSITPALLCGGVVIYAISWLGGWMSGRD
jgi:hypothetical protein